MLAITVEEMRRLEAACASDLDMLMKTAGENAAKEFLEHALSTLPPRHRRRFVVLAGKGNNGGDALCVAKYLNSQGQDVIVYSTCKLSDYSGTALSQSGDFPSSIPYYIANEQITVNIFKQGDVIIDGLLGIGLKGNARGLCADLINLINSAALPVYSIDCPSGLDCDTGLGSPAVHSDLTVTMAFPKIGFFQNNGPKCIGRLQVVPIGLPQYVMDSASGEFHTFTLQDAATMLHRRASDSHKNSFGHALCIAGSRLYSGAPFLSAEAAMRSGAGLVTLALPSETASRNTPLSIIISQIGKNASHFAPENIDEIKTLAERTNALLYGPGTGIDVPEAFLAELLRIEQPLVIDADGIRLLAKSQSCVEICRNRMHDVILTPHPGEMSALLKGIELEWLLEATRQEQALAAAKHCNAYILLKGQHSIVASPDGRLSFNSSGSPSLATAGTGDVLAGIIVSLLAQKLRTWDAVRMAAFIHGLAAELYPNAARSMMADDLLSIIPQAIRHISPIA